MSLILVDNILPEKITQMIDDACASVSSDNTAIIYRGDMEQFFRWMNTNKMTSPPIALDMFKQELKAKGLSAVTINRKLSAIKKFFQIADRNRAFPDADKVYKAVKAVENLRTEGRRQVSWVNRAGLMALLDAPDVTTDIGKRDRAVLGMLVYAGLRRAEVANMQWKHLVQHDGAWFFMNFLGKRNKIRTVYIPKALIDIIFDYAPRGEKDGFIIQSYDPAGKTDGAVTPMTIYRIVKKYLTMVGLDTDVISTHSLRRGYAEWLRKEGVDMRQIQLQLGHSSLATTQQYLESSLDVEQLSKVWGDGEEI